MANAFLVGWSMGVLALICDYKTYREVCISACYHATSLHRMRELFDISMRRLDLLPTRAELYLSDTGEDRLVSVLANGGIELSITSLASGDANLGEMYETRTQVPFAQLQVVMRRYGRLAYSFERQDAL